MKDMNLLSSYWKVPLREVYCTTFREWLAETVYCHVYLRLKPCRETYPASVGSGG